MRSGIELISNEDSVGTLPRPPRPPLLLVLLLLAAVSDVAQQMALCVCWNGWQCHHERSLLFLPPQTVATYAIRGK